METSVCMCVCVWVKIGLFFIFNPPQQDGIDVRNDIHRKNPLRDDMPLLVALEVAVQKSNPLREHRQQQQP